MNITVPATEVYYTYIENSKQSKNDIYKTNLKKTLIQNKEETHVSRAAAGQHKCGEHTDWLTSVCLRLQISPKCFKSQKKYIYIVYSSTTTPVFGSHSFILFILFSKLKLYLS